MANEWMLEKDVASPERTDRRYALDPFSPLERAVPLRWRVYEAIAELIAGGALKPGRHLVETEIAERLQVSRQPVREAFQLLQSDGWVDRRAGQGTFVHSPTKEEVDQVFAVRTLLESEAAACAAIPASEDDIDRLHEICDRGRESLAKGDDEDVVAANAELHRAVTGIAGNDVLSELIAQLDRRVRWYFRPLVRRRGERSWDEHEELIAAIASHDSKLAAEVMRAHTEATWRIYKETLFRPGPSDQDGRRSL
jgi:DNA-binding GntR family transcriptional regulator